MDGAMWRRFGVLVMCLAALAVLLATAGTAAASQAEYDKAYRIGLAAYTYGLPLLDTDITFRTMTSIDVPKGAYGPVNHFNNVRKLNNPGSTAVVAPGANSLSSIAWVDLRQEPQVLHVPRVLNHYFVLGLHRPVHDQPPEPGQRAPHPAGRLRPLRTRPARPADPGRDAPHRRPVLAAVDHRVDAAQGHVGRQERPPHPGPLRADAAQQVRHRLPPQATGAPAHQGRHLPAAQRPALLRRAGQAAPALPAAGARPRPRCAGSPRSGSAPACASREPPPEPRHAQGLKAAVAAGPAQIQPDLASLFLADFDKHDGYLLGGFGRYGTDYRLRAVVATIGLGAFTSDQAIFAMSPTDRSGQPLSGSSDYVMHLPSMPPVNEGWSVTVYSLQGFLISNPIDRYQFNDRSKLTRNPDGSVDIYLQATAPSDPAQAANWLPTAPGRGSR